MKQNNERKPLRFLEPIRGKVTLKPIAQAAGFTLPALFQCETGEKNRRYTVEQFEGASAYLLELAKECDKIAAQMKEAAENYPDYKAGGASQKQTKCG